MQKTIVSWLDVSLRREEIQKACHRPNRPDEVLEELHGSVTVFNSKSNPSDTFFTSTKLRKRNARFVGQDDINIGSDEEYPPIQTLGGKNYEKVKIFSVTEKSCVLADRRMTSIR